MLPATGSDFLLVPEHCRPGDLAESPRPSFAMPPSGTCCNFDSYCGLSCSPALGKEEQGGCWAKTILVLTFKLPGLVHFL